MKKNIQSYALKTNINIYSKLLSWFNWYTCRCYNIAFKIAYHLAHWRQTGWPLFLQTIFENHLLVYKCLYLILISTRITRTPAFWGYPRLPMITHTIESYFIPSQNEPQGGHGMGVNGWMDVDWQKPPTTLLWGGYKHMDDIQLELYVL